MTTLDGIVKDSDTDIEADARDEAPATPVEAPAAPEEAPAIPNRRRTIWSRVLAFGVLPGLTLLLTLGAGYLKWVDESAHDAALARVESLQTATDGAVALLSYQPDTVEHDLAAASDRLTGDFKDGYRSLAHDVVIPGSKQNNVSAVAKVAAAASVSATERHAVALVFVDQTVTVGAGTPTATTSALRIVLDKIHGRWLISRFDPV